MAPTPAKSSTPSSKLAQPNSIQSRTPLTKHRINFNCAKPSPNPNSVNKETQPADHPVEVIGRIRDYPDRKEKPISALHLNSDQKSIRVRTEIGYRDFSLDGVSLSEEEDLDEFYKKFVRSRINSVKLGDKCTVMMYGPTGAGKSHTMFGCAKQPGIVYWSLRDILGNGEDENEDIEQKVGVGTFVQVTVLEIYNEEIYDLLPSNGGGGGFSLGWPKGSASKVKLEVMGKKAKNATFISGTEAGKISKEIQKVEKRRIVKSTLCNERSSRSHCMIILDVPTVGGRLMLVDMAGSENIEQAGQVGLEAKMQTAKINQGNIALKRVVESIANGDSHVPFRDSKLTMLLQDSFEDDKSKILMILCASPDPKELHKTILTLEYGAKAKCIVRGPHTPIKEKGADDSSSAVILGSRIAAMDQFIYKLQMENKVREKEKNEARKELMKKEEEISALRAKLAQVEGEKEKGMTGNTVDEEIINLKVNERTIMLQSELDKKIQEHKKKADEFVEMERRKMEDRMWQQQQELEMLRRRLEDIESEFCRSREGNDVPSKMDGSSFAKRLMDIYADEDPGMEKSMDLDKSMDMEMGKQENNKCIQAILGYPYLSNMKNEEYEDGYMPTTASKSFLSTVFEEEEEEGEQEKEKDMDEEVQKEVIEEKIVCSTGAAEKNSSSGFSFGSETDTFALLYSEPQQISKDSALSRQERIQNIFTLCGNYRELSHHNATPIPTKTSSEDLSIVRSSSDKAESRQSMKGLMKKLRGSNEVALDSKENYNPLRDSKEHYNLLRDSKENCNPSNGNAGDLEVLVKWEASGENPGKLITNLKVVKDATLADVRKQIEIYIGADNQAFTFLALGDPTGAPVPKEEEASVLASKLPICNNQQKSHLACLRSAKRVQCTNLVPFSPLENKVPLSNSLKCNSAPFSSPKVAESHLSSPFITLRKNSPFHA